MPKKQSCDQEVRVELQAYSEVEIQSRIFWIRDRKIMIDSDLANLYGVSTKGLNQQVRRNIERFPEDFMFQLTSEETKELRSQIVTSKANQGHGGRRYLPLAFTEQGIAMLSGVLRSKRAIQVNVAIMRAFVQSRRWMATHENLLRRLEELEEKYDDQFKLVFEAIRHIMKPEEPPTDRRIGFWVPADRRLKAGAPDDGRT